MGNADEPSAVQALDAMLLLGADLREQDAAKAAFDAIVVTALRSHGAAATIGESSEFLSLKATDVAVTLAMAHVVTLARRTAGS